MVCSKFFYFEWLPLRLQIQILNTKFTSSDDLVWMYWSRFFVTSLQQCSDCFGIPVICVLWQSLPPVPVLRTKSLSSTNSPKLVHVHLAIFTLTVFQGSETLFTLYWHQLLYRFNKAWDFTVQFWNQYQLYCMHFTSIWLSSVFVFGSMQC